MASKPNPFGSTTEAIYQTLVRSALPLSTNDVYQSLMCKGMFLDISAKTARLDIAAKLRGLKKRGVISQMDAKVGKQMWQLDPETRAALPPEKTAKPAKPKAAPKPGVKTEPKPAPEADKSNPYSPLNPVDIPKNNLTLLQTRLNGMASLLAAVDMGVFKLTQGSALNLRDELINLTRIIETELEIPF